MYASGVDRHSFKLIMQQTGMWIEEKASSKALSSWWFSGRRSLSPKIVFISYRWYSYTPVSIIPGNIGFTLQVNMVMHNSFCVNVVFVVLVILLILLLFLLPLLLFLHHLRLSRLLPLLLSLLLHPFFKIVVTVATFLLLQSSYCYCHLRNSNLCLKIFQKKKQTQHTFCIDALTIVGLQVHNPFLNYAHLQIVH